MPDLHPRRSAFLRRLACPPTPDLSPTPDCSTGKGYPLGGWAGRCFPSARLREREAEGQMDRGPGLPPPGGSQRRFGDARSQGEAMAATFLARMSRPGRFLCRPKRHLFAGLVFRENKARMAAHALASGNLTHLHTAVHSPRRLILTDLEPHLGAQGDWILCRRPR